MVGDSWSDVVAARRAGCPLPLLPRTLLGPFSDPSLQARRAGCVPVLLATGHGQALAAALRRQGSRLPASLTAAALSEERVLAEWLGGRGEAEAALVREALCGGPVSVYETLAQAADALLA